ARFRAVVSHGYPDKLSEKLSGGFDGRDNPVSRPLLEGARFSLVPDLTEIDHPVPRTVAELGGVRTVLFVPLRRDDALLGAISSARQEVRPFSDKEIALLESFAAQAVIAMENARLLSELRESTDDLARSVDELTALNEVSQAVSSTLDLPSILSTILARSVDMAGADAGVIFRYSPSGHAYSLVEAQGWSEELVERVKKLHIGEMETGMGEAASRRSPIQFPDLSDRPSYPLRD